MNWTLEEAIDYYRTQGAPREQTALVSLLKEIQQEQNGAIPLWTVQQAADSYGVKDSLLLALIRRYPSLHLADTHCLQLCAGPNCSKRAALADFVEKTYGTHPQEFRLEYTSCLRMCGKGPNIKWDGRLYNHADEALIRQLTASIHSK